MSTKYLTAIIFTNEGKALKYRNVQGTIAGCKRFEMFAKSKKGKYLNYYDKVNKCFVGRTYL